MKKVSKNVELRLKGVSDLLNDDMSKGSTFYKRYFKDLPNINPILQRAGKSVKDLQEIMLDSQVSAAFELRKNNVHKLKWDVNRGTNNNFIANWAKEIIKGWDMPQLISDIIDCRAYGLTVLESNWQQREYNLIIKDIRCLPAHYFKFDSNGLIYFKEDGYNKDKPLPSNKYTVVRNKATRDNPYGESLLAKCYWPVTFKKGANKFWAMFIEKHGMPKFVGKINDTALKNIEAMNDMLNNLRADGNAVIQIEDSIEMLKGNDVSSSDIYSLFIKNCNDEITKILLSHNSALDSTAGELGNTSKAQTTMDIIAMSDKQLAESIIQDKLNKMVLYNWPDIEELPVFEFFEEADIDMQLAERTKLLYEIGVEPTEKFIQDAFGLKMDEFTLTKKSASTGPGAMFSEAKTTFEDIIEENLQKYVRMVENGDSYESIKNSLIAEFSADNKEIETIIGKAILFADLQAQKDEKATIEKARNERK